jgi:hypothetical protein
MTTHVISTTSRPTSYRRGGAARRVPAIAATLIAATLFLAVLIAEAALLALNVPSVADLAALGAFAGSTP